MPKRSLPTKSVVQWRLNWAFVYRSVYWEPSELQFVVGTRIVVVLLLPLLLLVLFVPLPESFDGQMGDDTGTEALQPRKCHLSISLCSLESIYTKVRLKEVEHARRSSVMRKLTLHSSSRSDLRAQR